MALKQDFKVKYTGMWKGDGVVSGMFQIGMFRLRQWGLDQRSVPSFPQQDAKSAAALDSTSKLRSLAATHRRKRFQKKSRPDENLIILVPVSLLANKNPFFAALVFRLINSFSSIRARRTNTRTHTRTHSRTHRGYSPATCASMAKLQRAARNIFAYLFQCFSIWFGFVLVECALRANGPLFFWRFRFNYGAHVRVPGAHEIRGLGSKHQTSATLCLPFCTL